MSEDPAAPEDGEASFRDAEEWLAERGVDRRPIRITPTDESDPEPDAEPDPGPEAEIGPREARRLAEDSAQRAPAGPTPPGEPPPGRGRSREPGRLEEEVSEAVAFARRSTAGAPQSEQRLAGKLRDRDYPEAVVEAALERCRKQGIVDDEAIAAAFVRERRERGHARRRIGRDLRKRGFTSETIEAALAGIDREAEDASARRLAAERARRLSDEDTETAFRRIVRYLARRGYPEGLARRVTRQVVFDGPDGDRPGGR